MLIYADDLVLVAETGSDLRVMIECFDLVCERRALKENARKSKVRVEA